MPSADAIDALLPQTQCTRCGFAGCHPYAEAIAAGEAAINQCPPGGTATITALAQLLARPAEPLNPANGVEGPPMIALIDEARCIGCAKCLPPCPVDAILGSRKQMHTVIEALCTGCELCIAPCPVDCIRLVPRSQRAWAGPAPAPADNRARYEARRARELQRSARRAAHIEAQKRAASGQRGCAG